MSYKPKMPGVDEALRKRAMYAYGVSLQLLMPDPRAPHVSAPLDARALAAACGLKLRRAKACLRGGGSAWLPHVQARRIVACSDLMLTGHVPGPGELVEAVPAVDFKALVRALRARGYTWTQIARRLGIDRRRPCDWASGRSGPSWLGGELLLHAWQAASTGEWAPKAQPARDVPDPGTVPAPV